MCGIIYSQSFDGSFVNGRVLEQYEKQIARGIEGFGAFNGKHIVKAAEESRILRWMKRDRNQSDLLLFHHRFPTSTINCRKAAHPFTTKDYFGDTQYVLIHNGGINNDEELFCDHQELGIDYHSLLPDLSFNDSEALLWDFALTMEGKQDKLKAYGNIAFICMKMVNGEPDKLYFGRNWSKPLNLLRNKEQMFLSSEGEGEAIDANKLYTYNYQLKRLTSRRFTIPVSEFKPYDYDQSRQSLLPYAGTCGYQGNWDDYDYDEPVNSGFKAGDQEYDRYGEIMTVDGVMWYDADGEEHYESYADYPAYGSSTNSVDKILRKHFGMQENIIPTENEINTLCFDYLKRAKGDYLSAYWMLEAAYEDVELQELGSQRTKQLRLLEACIDNMQASKIYQTNTEMAL